MAARGLSASYACKYNWPAQHVFVGRRMHAFSTIHIRARFLGTKGVGTYTMGKGGNSDCQT